MANQDLLEELRRRQREQERQQAALNESTNAQQEYFSQLQQMNRYDLRNELHEAQQKGSTDRKWLAERNSQPVFYGGAVGHDPHAPSQEYREGVRQREEEQQRMKQLQSVYGQDNGIAKQVQSYRDAMENGTAQEAIDQGKDPSRIGMFGLYSYLTSGAKNLSDDEKNTYRYIYSTYGTDAANKYLNTLKTGKKVYGDNFDIMNPQASIAKEEEIPELNSLGDVTAALNDKKTVAGKRAVVNAYFDNMPDDVKDLLDQYDEGYLQYSSGGNNAIKENGHLFSFDSTGVGSQRRNQVQGNQKMQEAGEALKEKLGINDSELATLLEYRQYKANYDENQRRNEEINDLLHTGNAAKDAYHAATMTAKTIATSPMNGMAALLGNATNSRPELGTDTYSPFYGMTNYSQNVRGNTQNRIAENEGNLGKYGSKAYGIGTSIGDSMVNATVGGALGLPNMGMAGKLIDLAPMGANAYATTLQQGLERGLSEKQAQGSAAVAGLAEMATEIFSLDHFWDMAKGSSRLARNYVVDWLAQAGIEGSEEVASDVINLIADNLINADQSEYWSSVREYAKTMSLEDAKAQATRDKLMEIGESFVGGAISGGVMGGAGIAMNVANTNEEARNAFEKGGLIESAQALSDNREDYKNASAYQSAMQAKSQAQQIAKKQEAGTEIKDSELRKLYWNINDALDTEAQTRAEDRKKNKSITVPEAGEDIDDARMQAIVNRYAGENNDIRVDQIVPAMAQAESAEELVRLRKAAEGAADASTRAAAMSAYQLNKGRVMSENNQTAEDFEAAEAMPTESEAFNAGMKGEELTANAPDEIKAAYNSGKMAALYQQSKASVNEDINGAKIQTANGNTVELTGKISGTGADAMVKTTSGKVKISDLEDTTLRYLYNDAASQTSEIAAQEYINNYKKGMPVGRYTAAFNRYYAAGATSTAEFQDLYDGDKMIRNWMDEDQLKAIYELGQNETSQQMVEDAVRQNKAIAVRGTGKVTDARKDRSVKIEYMPLIEAMAKATGMDYVLSDSTADNINGTFNRAMQRVVINTNNADKALQTLFHEGFGEVLQAHNAEGHQRVQNAIMSYIAENYGQDAITNIGKRYQKAYIGVEGTKGFNEAMGEAINDSIAGLFTTEDGIHDFAEWAKSKYGQAESKTILQSIADYFKGVADSIRQLLKGTRLSEPSRLTAQMAADRASEIRKMILDEMNVAVENAQNAEVVAGTTSNDAMSIRNDEYEGGVRYSIDTMAESLNLSFEKEGNLTVLKDEDGRRITNMTPAMARNTPLGAMIDSGIRNGFITEEQAKGEYKFVADLVNQMLKTQDLDMVFAVNSVIGFQELQSGPRADYTKNPMKSKNAGYVSNSDPQYSSTIDFTTICVKSQAIIDAMSETMKKLGRGLTENEITNIVYKNTHEAGEPVPCPVCYVFSRWVGLGSLFDKMNNLQKQYADADVSKIKADMAALDKQIAETQKKLDGSKKTRGKAKEKLYKELKEEIAPLEKVINAEKLGNKVLLSDAQRERYETINHQLDLLDNWTWLEKVRLSKNYKPVPADVLFDINAGTRFANEYPESWTYRTTRGPAMGKAATPYADEHLGQVVRGIGSPSAVGKNLGDLTKNPFIFAKGQNGFEAVQGGKLSAAASKMITSAIKKARVQNLLNGQRMQSTSDFRFEYALDYLMALYELQSVGAKVQLYTKVPESVGFLASAGAEINCSLMPFEDGYEKDADGNPVYDENGNLKLLFSDITGMHPDDAFRLSAMYDNVQPIVVGTNDIQIRGMMADPRITFIIPYHASGSGEQRYIDMMRAVGESVKSRQDYSAYQTESEIASATPEEKAARALRKAIVTGKTKTLTAEQKNVLANNEILHQLYQRFYGKDMNGNAARIENKYLDAADRGADGYGTIDHNTLNTFMSSSQAETIMPYEFWNKELTVDQADQNGRTFQEYCKSMGLYPRFSGYTAKGAYNAEHDFSKEPGYWKTIPDRKMYNNDGTYHEQQAINVSNMRMDYLDRAKTVEGITKPSMENDRNKVEMIVQKSIEDIEGVRHSLSDITPLEMSLEDFNENIHKVHAMNAVATVPYSTAINVTDSKVENARQLVDYAKAHGWDQIESDSVGLVKVDEEGCKDIFEHGWKRVPYYINAIPEVINHGIIVAADNNHKGKKYSTVTLVAPVTFTGKGYKGEDGGTFYTGVTVKRSKKDQTLHVVDVLTYYKEKGNPKVAPKIHDVSVADVGSLSLAEILKHVSDDVKLFKDDSTKVRYSLQAVDPIEPTSDQWASGATFAEAKAMYPRLFDTSGDTETDRNPTQIAGTVKTYRKVYDYLKKKGFTGSILDASSGLGDGTRVGRNEYGYDVDDIEPYPSEEYEKTLRYKDYSTLFKSYDFIINNAVMNVMCQDDRDALVKKLGEMLNPGGTAYVNVRAISDVEASKGKQPINAANHEWYMSNRSYQKGFSFPELIAYLQDGLGEDFTIEKAFYTDEDGKKKAFPGVSVFIHKSENAVMDPRYTPADNVVPEDVSDIRRSVVVPEVDDFFNDDFTTDEVGQMAMRATGSILAEGTQALKKADVDTKTIKRIAAKLRNQYGSTYDLQEFSDNLEKVFAYAQENDSVDYNDLMNVIREVAQPVIDTSTEKVGQEDYNNFMNQLRGRKIALTDTQKQEVINVFGSYRNFQTAMGNVDISNTGASLDSIWSELVEALPDYLEYDTAEGDMPIALYDLKSMLTPTVRNMYGGNNTEVAADLAMDIVEEYFEEAGKASGNEALKAAAEKMKAQKADYRKQVRDRYEQRLKEAKQELRDRYAKLGKEIRADRDLKIAELKAKNRAQASERRERLAANHEKRLIVQAANKLYNWAANPSKDHHIQNSMIEPVMDFLQAIDFVSPQIKATETEDGTQYSTRIYDGLNHEWRTVTGESEADVQMQIDGLMEGGLGSQKQRRWTDKMLGIKNIYDKVVKGEQFEHRGMDDLVHSLDKELAEQLQDLLVRNNGVARISQLGSEDLKTIKKVITNITHAVNKANRAFTNNEEISAMAEETLAGVNDKTRRKDHTKLGNNALNFLTLDMATPKTFFSQAHGDGVYKILRNGLNKKIENIRKASQFMETVLDGVDKETLKSWDTPRGYTVRGQSFQLTDKHLMSLYELSKRQQAMVHLPGGITITNIEMPKNGILGKLGAKVQHTQNEAIHLTDADIKSLTNNLTTQQKEVADKMQQYMATDCAQMGNEAARAMYGYDKFTDPNYFPIRTDRNSIKMQAGNVSKLMNGVAEMGFTKNVVPNARNGIVIADIFDVFTDHVSDMATYNAYAPAIADAIRWYNYRTSDTVGDFDYTETTQGAIQAMMGDGGKKYFEKLIRDISEQEQSSYISGFWGSFTSKYKVAAIGANIRVVAQQPTAIVRARNMIADKYLVQGLSAVGNLKEASDHAKEESSIAWWKSQGYYESNIGKSMKQILTGQNTPLEEIQEKSLTLAGLADDVTWAVLYKAVELEQADQFRKAGMDTEDDAFRKAVNERFDDIIDETQVVDSTLHRSQFMRATDSLNKLQGSFMAEPTKTYNMLLNAVGKAYESAEGNGLKAMASIAASKGFRKAAVTFVATNVANAAVQSLIDALRRARKDDDKDYWERWGDAMVENTRDNLNPANLLPWVKDVSDIVSSSIAAINGESTYNSNNSRMDLAAVQNFANAVVNTVKFARGEGSKTAYGVAYSDIQALSQVTGIPVYNLIRDVSSLYDSIRHKFDELPDIFETSTTHAKTAAKNKVWKTIEEGGDYQVALQNAFNKGISSENFASSVTSQYKPIYLELLQSNPTEAAQLRNRLEAVYKYLAQLNGKDYKPRVDKWADQ